MPQYAYTQYPTQYASEYASHYFYTISLSMPTHSLLHTGPQLSVSFKISNLKTKYKNISTSLLEKCFFSMPTHSIPHSMPHSILIQKYTVCLHTVSCAQYPTKYAYTVYLTVCLTVCLHNMPQYVYTQYPTHRLSLINVFQFLKSQIIIIKIL